MQWCQINVCYGPFDGLVGIPLIVFAVLSRLLIMTSIITTPMKLTSDTAASNVSTTIVAVKCV